MLSVINHPNEGVSNWRDAFECPRQRGLNEVNLLVCDGLTKIENVITEVLPLATVQLCTVHLTRNILTKVKPFN
jgi:transposase-like protein